MKSEVREVPEHARAEPEQQLVNRAGKGVRRLDAISDEVMRIADLLLCGDDLVTSRTVKVGQCRIDRETGSVMDHPSTK